MATGDVVLLAVNAVLSALPTVDVMIELLFACSRFLLHYDILSDAGDVTNREVPIQLPQTGHETDADKSFAYNNCNVCSTSLRELTGYV